MSEPRFKQSREIAEAEFSLPVVRDAETFEDEEPDAFARIRAYCESGSGTGVLGVYRAVPNSKKQNFIADIDARDFSPGTIKERFGGGDYIIKAYDERSKVRLNQSLSIEGEPIIGSTKLVQSPQLPPAQPAFDIREFATMMQESNRQMLTGLVSALQPQQNSRADMLQEMLTMKELLSSGNTQPQQGGIEMIMKGIELARSIEPRTGEATGMDVLLESIKSFAPAIGEVVKHSQSTRRSAPPQPQPQPQRALGNATTSEPAPTIPQPENEENMLFKYYVGLLVGFANEGRDPVLYADLIADNLPEDKIMELLNNPQVLDYLASINPGVNENRAWFNDVLSELKIIMSLTTPELSPSVGAPQTNLPDKNAVIGDGNDSAA